MHAGRVRSDVKADRARQRRAGVHGQRQHEREYADRRSEDDPAHEDEHRVAQSAEETRQRLRVPRESAQSPARAAA